MIPNIFLNETIQSNNRETTVSIRDEGGQKLLTIEDAFWSGDEEMNIAAYAARLNLNANLANKMITALKNAFLDNKVGNV